MKQKYDSAPDTKKHIKKVANYMSDAGMEIIERGAAHDESKLGKKEKPYFDKYTPLLKETTYGSDEYKKQLKGLKVALDHHYKKNTHHPEHYKNGIDDMTLFDIMELFFDWKSASERMKDGNFYNGLKINKKRFHMSDQLVKIFINTAKSLKWKK